MEKVRQGIYSLSEPMKQLEADLRMVMSFIITINHEMEFSEHKLS